VKLIQTQTLATTAASIEFISIPQTFTDLVLLFSLRGNHTTAVDSQFAFNNSTSGFNTVTLQGTGTARSTFSSGNRAFQIPGSDATANTFTSDSLYIPNYAASGSKSFSVDHTRENNTTSATTIEMTAGHWASSSALTAVRITVNSGSFVAGSTISLYGITRGSIGTITIT
jgi:hypothetical protein